MRKIILITAAVLVVYCILAFFTGNLIGLQGSKLWILRTALWVLGLAAAGIVVWFFWNKKKQEQAEEYAEGGGAGDDIDHLVRDAEMRLAASRIAKGAQLGDLPAIFLIGETSSAKTTTLVNSGLDPELLAGQVYHDKDLIPTRALNLWYAHGTIFAEAAGNSVAEAGKWAKIARRLQPGRLRSAFASGPQAPRAAMVVIEAEAFTRAGATDQLAASARTLRARLGEVSQTLGINLPVYVLLTKMDRVPFFAEFVRNLTNEEAAQVLGVTVPLNAESREGVYAEQETSRLTGLFEQLFRSLANARPAVLSREHDPARLPGAYEFPREFRKLRSNLVQFLVDLCRPSQLTVGPFLRGFYFSGVRPVVINEVAPPVPQQAQPKSREAAMEATSMFRADAVSAAAQPAAPRVVGTRKVPQWVFLSYLFHRVLLADAAARGASGASTKTSLMRRILLGAAAALCLFCGILLAVSYSKNRTLETTARDAAQGIEAVQPGGLQVASFDTLQKLERLRQSLATLTQYHREGPPLSYRWGLYVGEDLYPEVRRLYFDRFNRAMFGQTQQNLVKIMSDLPATPGPEFGPTYDTLKAYLMTTSHHEKTTREFLSPVLLDRWSAGKEVGANSMQLAQKQFDFYSDELKIENPYSSEDNKPVVAKARAYLNQFGGFERVYAAMLADAGKGNPPINFNRQYPGSAETVLEPVEVPGAFSKGGWDFMAKAIKNPQKYFSGEQWVLGDQGAAKVDEASLGKQLADRYHSDFIKHWRAYLKGASVVKFKDLKDASAKLNTLSSSQTPLLALLWVASQNTSVDVPEVAGAFQPVQVVTPPGSPLFIAAPNQPYVNALLTLQTSIDAAAGAQQLTPEVAKPTLDNAQAARLVTRQLAQGFKFDPEAHVESTVQKFLEEPITNVEAMLKQLGPAELNAKGRELCAQFRSLLNKYPFNPNQKVEATIDDVNKVFRKPDGALWTFYEGSLQKALPKQGSEYVATPDSGLTPPFVAFFNRAAAFSEAIYAGGSQDPHIRYALKPLPSEGIRSVGLVLDGQKLNYSGGNANPQQFTWQGSGQHEAKGTMTFGNTPLEWADHDGLWAIFKFFWDAEKWQPQGNVQVLEWMVRTGKNQKPITLSSGNPLTLRFQLDMAGAPPIFQRGYFSGFGCVANVAK
jgi:type VI secretion system protein ImpL